MISDFVNLNSNIENRNIDENLETVYLSFSTKDRHLEVVEKLFHELKTISARDQFELFVEADGNSESITDTSISALEKLRTHLRAHHSNNSALEIVLTLRKAIANRAISVYFLDRLASHLREESLGNTLISLSKRVDESLTFEVFETISSFGSSRISFVSHPIDNHRLLATEYKDKLELFRDNCLQQGPAISLLPDDFYLKSRSASKELNEFFDTACALLCIVFIANTSEIQRDKLSYKVNGYRAIINKDISFPEIAKDHEILFQIYSWAYFGGSCADKLGLIRNVLSLHVDSSGHIRYDSEVWMAIKSNYQIYLQENIQSYLEVKNKISEFLLDMSSKAYTYADDFLGVFKNNVFILLGFFISAILIEGLKENKLSEVFSPTNSYAIYFLSAISLIWMGMSISETLRRYDHASASIKSILSRNYQNLLMQPEIADCVDPIISDNRAYVSQQIRRYSIWWLVILAVFVLGFAVAPKFLPHKVKEARPSTATSLSTKGTTSPSNTHSTESTLLAERLKVNTAQKAVEKPLPQDTSGQLPARR